MQPLIIAEHNGGDVAAYVSTRDALSHPQTGMLQIVRTVSGSDGVSRQVRAFPGRFSDLQPLSPAVAPQLGEHTSRILDELAGRPAAA